MHWRYCNIALSHRYRRLRYDSHSLVCMVVADDLAPPRRRDICNRHDYVVLSVEIGVAPTQYIFSLCLWKIEINNTRFNWNLFLYPIAPSLASNIANKIILLYYCDVIMGVMASQITNLTIVYSTVHSGADQRKHQSSASLAFVRGIHRSPVNCPHKWPVARKIFSFDDVIMACGAIHWTKKSVSIKHQKTVTRSFRTNQNGIIFVKNIAMARFDMPNIWIYKITDQ